MYVMEELPVQQLRERGVRVTPQRVLIWGILARGSGHFTAEELWDRASPELPGLEISTVYRTLEALGEAGLVVETRPPEGPRMFEARPDSHPHLFCENCGRVFHLQDDRAEELLRGVLSEESGFHLRRLHITATGLCDDCSEPSPSV